MEQTMFDAIMEMKATEKFDETILRTKALRDTWGKRLKFFTIDGNGLLWNGQKVPTIPDMYTVLEPVHKRKACTGHKIVETGIIGGWLRITTFYRRI